MARKKPESSTGEAGPKPFFRSRVTAGLDLLPSVDGRSTWARIMRDTYHAMLAHAGGAEHVSEAKRLLARRVAAFEAELIHLEDRFALARVQGEQPEGADLDLYTRMSGGQRRCLEALGWERTARDVTPDPLTYAKQYDARAEDAEVAP